MLAIGLSGGIGSGKSTVARLLEVKGATIVDADVIGHAVLARGGAAFGQLVARFGSGILGSDGEIDRACLGAIVFADREARLDLEAVTHPLIFFEMARQLAEHDLPEDVVVVDAPLLVETRAGEALGLQALVVVDAEPADQIERALSRGTSRERVEAVMAAQAPAERKVAAADYIIDNRGTLADLEAAVENLWKDLSARFGRV